MVEPIKEYFPGTIAGDLLYLCVDKQIGDGSTRKVFKSSLVPNTVFKFETTSQRFQNILEWETWEIVKTYKHKLWFAPCLRISDCGTILVQAFCRDLEDNELPEEIPSFFADIKRENFGMYEGHVVCRDYGNTFLIDKGLNNKMKKAEW